MSLIRKNPNENLTTIGNALTVDYWFVFVSIQRRESEIGVLTTGFELAELAILTTVVLKKKKKHNRGKKISTSLRTSKAVKIFKSMPGDKEINK